MPLNPELESIPSAQAEKSAPWSKKQMASWELTDVLDWLEDNIAKWQEKGLSPFPWNVSEREQIKNIADLKNVFAAQIVTGDILLSVMQDDDDEILKEIGIEQSKLKSDIRDQLRQQIINHVVLQQEKAKEKQSLLATGAKDDSNASVFQLSLTQHGVMHKLMCYQDQFDLADLNNTKAYCMATKGLREQMEDAEAVGCIHGFEMLSEQQRISVLEKTYQFLNVSLATHPEAASAGTTFCATVLTKDQIYCANIGDTMPFSMADNTLSPLVKEIRSLTNERDRERLIKILPKNDVDPGLWGHSYIYPDDVENLAVTMRVGAPKQSRLNFPFSMGDFAKFGITGKLDKIKQMATPDIYIHRVADVKASGAILIGCDGLTEAVRMSGDVLQASTAYLQTGVEQATTKEPLEFVKHLVTKAFKDGSGDNITALMLPYNAETLAQLNDKSLVVAVSDGHGGPLISKFLSLCFIPILQIQVKLQQLESRIEIEMLQSKSEEVLMQAKKQALQAMHDLELAESKAILLQTVAEYKASQASKKSSHGASRSTLFQGQKPKSDKPVEYKSTAKDLAQSVLELSVTREKKDYDMETMKDGELREQLQTINMLIAEANRGIEYADQILLDPYQVQRMIDQYDQEKIALETVLSDLIKQRERYQKHVEKRTDSKGSLLSLGLDPLKQQSASTDSKPVSTGQLSDDFIRKLTFLSRRVSLMDSLYNAVDFEDRQIELLCKELGVDLTQLAKDGSFKEIDPLTATQLQAIVDEVREVREDREVRNGLR